ncbi:MAG: SDR family oxidoreductase [Myxococcales bacterium]|nr:SDR family oxidoreductase [Myxococcales bacterium]
MKRALVTGASGGIGRCFAKHLAEEGFAVTLVSRNTERLNQVAESLAGDGHRVLAADLSTDPDVQRVCADIAQSHYDLLINNAGIGLYGPLVDSDWERLIGMQRLNCDALLALSYAFLTHARDGSALMNVASVLGLVPFPNGGALYAATKAFVVSLSQSLWEEERKRGVHVMALCPGVTDTDFFAAAGGDPRKPPPKSVTQTADEVVREALDALACRNAPIVVTGLKNRLFVAMMRGLSRKATSKLMAKATPQRSPNL